MIKKDEKHTELPWHYQNDSDAYTHIIRDKSGSRIIAHFKQDASGLQEANAAFIVKACNEHEKLLQVVKWSYSRLLLLGQYEGRETEGGQKELAALRDVIATAEGIDPEDVQNDFEEAALIKKYCKQAEDE